MFFWVIKDIVLWQLKYEIKTFQNFLIKLVVNIKMLLRQSLFFGVSEYYGIEIWSEHLSEKQLLEEMVIGLKQW